MLESKNCQINIRDEVCFITFPNLSETGLVNHGFSTRLGGVSEGRYSTMNLSHTNGDNPEAVKENFKRICKAIGVEVSSLVTTHQTHTVNIMNIESKLDNVPDDIDGIITNKKGITLCSSYADCVPLIFLDPVKKVIATSHSGWRGTVGLIGKLTAEKMVSDYGCDLKDIKVAIGPAICKDCYEVDDVVAQKIKDMNFLKISKCLYDKGNGHYMLDLKEVCYQTLIHTGLKKENILVSDICTCCNSEYLHSHRATKGERGNLMAFIALK